ncbi:MAG TPA: hypothetical protein VII08_00240 [Myxococcales bacterium]
MSNVPAFLRAAVLERVAEGWPADRIAEWLGEKYGVRATGSDVLSTRYITRHEGRPKSSQACVEHLHLA